MPQRNDPRLDRLRDALRLLRASPSSREVKDPIEEKILGAAATMNQLIDELAEQEGKNFDQGLRLRKLEEEWMAWRELIQFIYDVKHRIRTGTELLDYVLHSYEEPIIESNDEELKK